MSPRRIFPLALSVLATLLASGCLEAEKTTHWAYDQSKDEFRCLTMWKNIHSKSGTGRKDQFRGDEDATALLALYNNRAHLLTPPPTDFGFSLNLFNFNEPAAVRLGPKEYASINLGSPQGELKPVLTQVPLDQIRILPGEMYTTTGGGLAYYHQIVFPGPVVDTALAETFARLRTEFQAPLKESIAAELVARKAGQPAGALDQLTHDLVPVVRTELSGESSPDLDLNWPKDRPLFVFDDQTLALYKDGDLSKIVCQRDRGTLSLFMPLSEHDAKGVMDLVAMLRAELAAAKPPASQPGTGPASQPDLKHRLELLTRAAAAIQVTQDKGVVRLTFDLARLLPLFNELNDEEAKDDEATPPAQAMAKAIRDKLKPNDTLKSQDIVQAFIKNQLKGTPVESISPGEGLGRVVRTPETTPAKEK